MSEENRSFGGRGPPWIRRGAFTHRSGDSAYSNDYQRLLSKYSPPPSRPPEVLAITALSLLALLATPVMLFLAWLFLHAVVRDAFVNDNRFWLVGWGVASMALLLIPLSLQTSRALFLQRAFVALVIVATVAASVGYVKLGLDAHASASTSAPERTYELLASCGRRCTYHVHQRADGSTVEGVNLGPAVPYATTCTRVQRIDGDHGFSWIRVLERSQPSLSGLGWPIRREDCFGDKPVSSLKG